MNTNTTIFKIHKILHFVKICEKSLFEISDLRELNYLITKSNDRTTDLCKNESFSCMIVVALDQNVKTYATIKCKFLLVLIMGLPELICASWIQCNK